MSALPQNLLFMAATSISSAATGLDGDSAGLVESREPFNSNANNNVLRAEKERVLN